MLIRYLEQVGNIDAAGKALGAALPICLRCAIRPVAFVPHTSSGRGAAGMRGPPRALPASGALPYLDLSGVQGFRGRMPLRSCMFIGSRMELPMHKSVNRFALAGVVAAITLLPAAAGAQDEKPPYDTPDTATKADTDTATGTQAAAPSPDMDARMQSWPADQRAAFQLWPAATQAYFWSLTEARQAMFWALPDSDKVRLSAMAEPQRESIWAQIEASTAQPPA